MGGGRGGGVGKEISIFIPLLTKHKLKLNLRFNLSKIPQCISWGLPSDHLLGRGFCIFLTVQSCTMNSSTGFNVLSPEFIRPLLWLPLLCGHFPPHRCYYSPAWATRKCGLSCLNLVQQIRCPEKIFLPPPLKG